MSTAFKRADILIPNTKKVDMEAWAVVACDQYTSEPDYWNETKKITESKKSALNLILPEIYLADADAEEKINKIHRNMNEYMNENIFDEFKNSMIYVERIQSDGKLRSGIIGMIDLEEYDFHKGSNSQVRATEATVIERIPPRIKIRQGASLELPHIMILIDDDRCSVIEPLSEKKENMKQVYAVNLMQGGGSIRGYLLDNAACENIESSLSELGNPDLFNNKYNLTDNPVLLYAMGDGNHSLATAKEFYENLKKDNPDKDFSNHPARYALAEIVNLHSDALEFEAIHRIVTEINTDNMLNEMIDELKLSEIESDQSFTYVTKGIRKKLYIHKPTSNLTVGSLQNFIDKYINNNGGKVDYIHGVDVVEKLSMKNESAGFILNDMSKEELFPTVIKDGALPRKTFSMGHAEDKRYYIECRKIM